MRLQLDDDLCEALRLEENPNGPKRPLTESQQVRVEVQMDEIRANLRRQHIDHRRTEVGTHTSLTSGIRVIARTCRREIGGDH